MVAWVKTGAHEWRGICQRGKRRWLAGGYAVEVIGGCFRVRVEVRGEGVVFVRTEGEARRLIESACARQGR